MKIIIVLISFAAATMSQRPSYAGLSPKGYPELASRFKDSSEDSGEVSINNRLGQESTAKIPVDARGDFDLVNRLNQWPQENKPFWLINAQHIENHRNPVGNNRGTVNFQSRGGFGESIPVKPELPRPSFAGGRQ